MLRGRTMDVYRFTVELHSDDHGETWYLSALTVPPDLSAYQLETAGLGLLDLARERARESGSGQG
jgi:hypothetical protein